MTRSRLIAALITLAWLVSMGALIQRHYAPYETTAQGEAPPAWLMEEKWTGIYQGTNKVGYVVSHMVPEDEGYMATDNLFMNLTVMGAVKEIEMKTEAHLDEGLRLKTFTFNMLSDVNIAVEGKVEGRELVMALDMGGVKTEKRLHMSEAPYMNPALSPSMRDLAPGSKFRVPIADPASLSGDSMEIQVLGEDRITVMGLERETYKLIGNFKGSELTMWATPEGEILKQEGMGFTYIDESEEEARKLGTASIDLIADLAVPSDTVIPEDTKYLKVRLKGIRTAGLELDGGVQRLFEGNVVEIEIPDRVQSVEAPNGMEEYLRESFLIEADDPSIESLSAEIVEDEKQPLHRARLISEWVDVNVRDLPTMTLPSALEVLRSRRGDCNEHTALYTALARAAGVPTRVAVGIVHKDGYFFYHAWPEIYMDGWVPIDPTLGQFPADATHIRLLTGGLDNQLKLGAVIGKLSIEVIESR